MKKLALALGTLALGCGKEAPTPPPPLPVQVMAASSRDVPVMAEFTGEVRGAEDVQVMARVAGFLQEQAYREGELVRKGDLLFVIDPKPFEAAASQARAAVAEAQAMLSRATVQVNRLRPLAAQNAVSQQDLDNAVASEAASKAALEGAQAQLETALLNLGYTRVTSPMDGMAGLLKSTTTSTEVYAGDKMVSDGETKLENKLLKMFGGGKPIKMTQITRLDKELFWDIKV